MSIKVPLRCGIGRHMIEGTPKLITNERHINFVKKIRPEFRVGTKIPQKLQLLMFTW